MAARTRLLERVAALSQEKLNQPERALKAYERILATDPRNRKAALALVPLYRAAQKWPRLLATYEVLLGPAAAGDGVGMAERLELFAEARRISEQRLGSKALAFQWCARAFEAAAQNPDVRTDLERLAGEADEWGALAALYEARFAVSTDAEERIWLLRRVLRISATRLFKPQDTRRAAEQILAEVGYDEEADGALETVLTQAKAWPELAKLLHARADRAPDAAERVKLLLRIAQIEEERVADLAAAAATWAAILDVEPTNERARRALVRVSEARQDWTGVVEALRGDLASRGRAGARRLEGRSQGARGAAPPHRQPAGDAAQGRRRDVRLVPRGGAGEPLFGAGHRRARAAGGSRSSGARGDRAHDAAALRADRERRQAGRRERGAALRRRHAGRAGRPAGEAAGALRRAAQRSGQGLPGQPGAVRDRSLGGGEPRGAARVRRRRRRHGRARRQAARARPARPKIATCGATSWWSSPSSRRSSRDGRRRRRRSTRRSSPPSRCTSAPSARWRASTGTGSAGRSCARSSTPASWRRSTRASGSICWRRSPSSTRRRSPIPTTRSRRTRRCWSSIRPTCAPTARSSGSTPRGSAGPISRRCSGRASASPRRPRCRSWSSGAPTCAPDGSTTSPARSICWKGSSRRRPTTKAPAGCSRSCWRSPPSASASRRSWRRSTRRAAPGRAWRRSSRCSARCCRGRRRRRCWRAWPTCRRTSCRRGPWRSPPGARCWPPTRLNPDALPEIERLGHDARAVLRAGRRLSGAGVPARRLRHQRPRRSAVARRAALRRAAQQPARRHRRLEAGPQPRSEQPADGRAGRGGAGGALRRDQRRRQPGQDAAAAGALGRRRRRGRRSCSASPGWKRSRSATPRRRWPRCGRSWRSTRRTRTAIDALDRIFEAGANHRQRVEILRKRIGLSGDASARQELWRSVASLLEKDVGDVDEAIAACVSILDENPEDDQALETLARLYEQQGRHRDRLEIVERRLALRKPKDAERLAPAQADRQAAGGAARRRDRRARALARGARTRAGRRGGAGGAGAFPGARHRRGAAAGGRAGARADLRKGRSLRRAGGDRSHLRRGAGRRPRAPRRADAAGGARRDAARRHRGGAADDGAGHPRRADRAGAPGAARRLRAPGRPPAPRRGDGALPRHQPRRPRRGAQAPARSHHRRRGGRAGRRGDGGRLLPPHPRSRPRRRRHAGRARHDLSRQRRRAGALRDPPAARRAGQGAGHRGRAARPDRRAGGDQARAARRRHRRLRAGRRDRARRSHGRAGARSPLHQGRALERSDSPARRPPAAGAAAGEGAGRPPLPPGADRARSARRSRGGAGAPEAGSRRHARSRRAPSPCSRGCSTTWASRGRRPRCSSRSTRGAATGSRSSRLARFACCRSRIRPSGSAWTKRIARLYEEQLEDFDSALRWYGKVFQEAPTERQATEPLLRLADKLDRWQDAASLLASYLDGRAERRAGGARHRAPHRRDLRPAPGRAPRGAEVLPAPLRRAPRRPRDDAALRERRSSAGEPGRSCASSSTSRPAGRRTPRRASRSCAAAPSWTRRSSTTRTAPSGRCARRWRSIRPIARPPRSSNGCCRRPAAGRTWPIT